MSGPNRISRTALCAMLLLLAAGCVSQGQIGEAINAINKVFQAEYERILDDRGTRSFKVPQGRVFVALHAGLARLGMKVVDQDPQAGTLTVSAPAPRPLDSDEWQRAAAADTPLMHKTVCPIIGNLACQQVRFEPEGLDIVINATVLPVVGGSEVSLTTRMRQITEPISGMPRREYPPPTGVGMALDKVWRQLDHELAEQDKRR
jgi:hypothetical protein